MLAERANQLSFAKGVRSVFPTTELSKVAAIYSGFAFKSGDLSSEGVPVIKIANIQNKQVLRECNNYLPEQLITRKLQKYFLEKDDVLIAMTGAGSVGKVGKMRRMDRSYLVNQRVAIVRTNIQVADPEYIYQVLSEDKYEEILYGLGLGAGQPNVSPSQIGSLIVPLPSLPTQQKIAAILLAYDNLIENNIRRIAILEEMAQRIYEEWFVRFHFPGHTKVKMLESKIGLVPKGWEIMTVPQVIEVDPTTIVPRNGLKPFVPMSSLSETNMLITNIEEREGNSGSKFRNGDTLFARITPCLENGKTGFVNFLPSDEDVAFGSTEFIVLRSKTATPEYVYLLARSDEFRDHAIKSMSGATGRQRVKAECFNEFCIALPPKEPLELFTDTVSPMFRAIRCYGLKIQNLRATRDLLLPKLISGELDVSHFPIPNSATV
jgi:type I restriction enzyme, S subunit